MEWWEALIGGSAAGSVVTAVVGKALNRRKDSADSSKVEAEVIQAYQAAIRAASEMTISASAEIEKARKEGTGWYDAVTAVRGETVAMIAQVRAESAAELSSLRGRNETLSAAVEAMARQLDQRTVDQAEVEWAKLRNNEYEAMKTELLQLRQDVAEVPHLRAEVRRLTVLLEETQREQRLDHEAMRDSLAGGTDLNG